jgi:hypothetical protein
MRIERVYLAAGTSSITWWIATVVMIGIRMALVAVGMEESKPSTSRYGEYGSGLVAAQSIGYYFCRTLYLSSQTVVFPEPVELPALASRGKSSEGRQLRRRQRHTTTIVTLPKLLES